MSRTTRLAFGALALFLVVFPLTLQKPGLPMNLKSDEPAYYLMALSLAHDFDLRCEVRDIQRLRSEYPFSIVENLILMTDDGWRNVYFGKPYLISLVATPLVRLFGADGFVATNMALLLAAVWLGALWLRRFNPDGTALLYSAGFFLLSNAFAYVFWLHTEVLCIFAVTACLYLGLTGAPAPLGGGGWRRAVDRLRAPALRPFWSGAVLMAAAYNKPILALLGLPVVVAALGRRSWRDALVWCAGAAAGGALICGLAMALTGHPSPYLGVERTGVRVEQYDRMPIAPEPAAPAGAARKPEDAQRNSWWWIFRLPEIDHRLPENVLYFFVGRHTGLFLYMPFTLISLLLFAFARRREREQWALVVALAGVALFFLTLIPFNWHGGGGFIGNRYFVNAYPGFLFLVTRVPALASLAGYALAGLFVGPILFTPFGAPVPNPTLQAHVRNRPFRFFPFEMTLVGQIPGYRGLIGADTWFFGRRDVVHPVGDEIWVGGGAPVELWLRTYEPLVRPVFQITTEAAPNFVWLRVGDAEKGVRFETLTPPGNSTRIVLAPSVPERVLDEGGKSHYYPYKLLVRAETQAWKEVPYQPRPELDVEASGAAAAGASPDAARPPGKRSWKEEMPDRTYLVGASIALLGEEAELEADVYSIVWTAGAVPPQLRAGRLVRVMGKVRNTSAATWRARGATRVSLAYHWRAEDGSVVEWEGLRTPLPDDVPAGGEVAVTLEIATPERPGRYLLELDALRERQAWFSDRHPGSAPRIPVEVVPVESP
jgi:hypothetical protein